MADILNLDILTPDGRVDLRPSNEDDKPKGDTGPVEVEGVELPAALGEMGVRPRHVPFLTPLVPGVVRFRLDGEDRRLAVAGGFLEIGEGGSVTVLTSQALRSWEIDTESVKEAHAEAVSALKEHTQKPMDDAEVTKLSMRRDWCDAQLRATQTS